MAKMVIEISNTVTTAKVNLLVTLMKSFSIMALWVGEKNGVWSLGFNLWLHYFVAVFHWVNRFSRSHFLISKIEALILIS